MHSRATITHAKVSAAPGQPGGAGSRTGSGALPVAHQGASPGQHCAGTAGVR